MGGLVGQVVASVGMNQTGGLRGEGRRDRQRKGGERGGGGGGGLVHELARARVGGWWCRLGRRSSAGGGEGV